MNDLMKVAVPDAVNSHLQSDRNRQQILASLTESQGKEDSLSFSAKEVRGLLSQIIHLEARVERLARKL